MVVISFFLLVRWVVFPYFILIFVMELSPTQIPWTVGWTSGEYYFYCEWRPHYGCTSSSGEGNIQIIGNVYRNIDRGVSTLDQYNLATCVKQWRNYGWIYANNESCHSSIFIADNEQTVFFHSVITIYELWHFRKLTRHRVCWSCQSQQASSWNATVTSLDLFFLDYHLSRCQFLSVGRYRCQGNMHTLRL